MGWEWRLFFQAGEVDVWKLLKQKQPLFAVSHKRTDVYVLCTESVSVKFRHSESLEFKIREKRHECGAELWAKAEFHDVSLQKLSEQKLKTSTIEKLEAVARSYGQDMQPVFAQAIECLKGNWRCVEVSKSRTNGYYSGVQFEQTDILKDTQTWQSICFEGRLEKIIELVTLLATTHSIITSHVPKGYPEFLLNIE